MPDSPPVALTIAGSDSSAGAGIQADLKTFQHFGVFGLTAITCVVAETPAVVKSVHEVPPSCLEDQLRVLLEAYPIAAVKTGMLYSAMHIGVVARVLADHPAMPLVVDPVMVASTGDALMEESAVDSYRELLFPRATVITPNLDEARVLLGRAVADEAAMAEAGRELFSRHGAAILVKGGHLGAPVCSDLLVDRSGETWFRATRIDTAASHGTGCTLSAAIAARLALEDDLAAAIAAAKDYLGLTLSRPLAWGDLAMLNQGTLPLA